MRPLITKLFSSHFMDFQLFQLQEVISRLLQTLVLISLPVLFFFRYLYVNLGKWWPIYTIALALTCVAFSYMTFLFVSLFCIVYSNMTICAETSFSSMRTQLFCNNRTALPFCVHISSLGFSSNVAVLFLFIFD